MKKTAITAALLTSVAWPAFADSTINNLSAGSALTGTEKIPMFQTANPAVTTTPSAIKTYIGTGTLTLAPLTTGNAITISANPTNAQGVIAFLNSIAGANTNITSADGAISISASSTTVTLLNSNYFLPSTSGAINLGAASNTWLSTYSNAYVSSGTAPTLTGTCSAPTMAGGNTAGTMTTGTGCSGTTIILTFALTAPTGWACNTVNRTLSTRVMPQTGSSTTTATFTGTTSNNDVLGYSCLAY